MTIIKSIGAIIGGLALLLALPYIFALVVGAPSVAIGAVFGLFGWKGQIIGAVVIVIGFATYRWWVRLFSGNYRPT